MNKLTRIFAIYVSLLCTFIDSIARRVLGRFCTDQHMQDFINKHGLSSNSNAYQISEAITKSFVWRRDSAWFDYAKAPLEFLYDGRDDCDGFAMFSEELLNRLGMQDVFRMYVRSSSDGGHAICVAKFSDGFYWQIGNWPTFQFSSGATSDIGKSIAMKMAKTNDPGALTFCIKFKYNRYQDYFEQ